MMKENRIVVKAPFKERWEAFKKAYYEWALYNQYKEDPYPDWHTIGLEEQRRTIPTPRTATEYVYASAKAGAIADRLYWAEMKARKKRVKAKKKRLRGNLKRTFLDLF
ncbi:hypothetical protein [Murdochiella massiliensis]|uniref:hypothetical protein n=1 Tax=Murdochiella massiliensis TaxID=1673723 RepID=UPI0008329530|nr:hypothetical protein [Murdochiella massiliensis]